MNDETRPFRPAASLDQAKGTPRPRKQRHLPPAVQRFAFLKAVAHFEGAWEQCRHRECRIRRQCTGGPRGTMLTSGVPLCRSNAPAEWWAQLGPLLDGEG